jgi:hypothetical protein
MMAVHVGFLVIIALFTVGFCTRVMTVLTWLAVVSYIQRAPNVLFGMDTMVNLTLLYLMLAPAGAALSVDRLIQRYWRTWRALRAGRSAPHPMPQPPQVSARLALRLLQINFCLIYLAAGLSKLLGSAWWNGTAMWWTMVNWEFAPLEFQWYLDAMRFLAEHRWLWELATSSGVAFTLLLEIGFPFLVWTRARPVVVGLAVLLHTTIAVLMGLKTFGIIMVAMLMAFVAPELIRRLLARLFPPTPALQLACTGRDPRQVRRAALVAAADVGDQVAVVHQAAGPLRLTTADGERLTGRPLFGHLVRSLRTLWPLAPLAWVLGSTAEGG